MTNHTLAAKSAPSTSLALHVVAVLAIMLLAAMGLQHVQLGPASPTTPVSGEFSLQRAMQQLQRIAQRPHPMGTEEHDRVRDELMSQLEALGVAPQLHADTALAPDHHAVGKVQNIVARLHGTTPGKAVLLSAHYDSAPGSPGAADDGASVAAILETLRVLKAGPPLRNDVVVLFTDGEEAGLLGARLFVEQHPWARHIGVALNYEYRGNSGPVWMFDTSRRNGRLIREWKAALPDGLGSSLLSEAYQAMPNDTDLSIFKDHFPGLNFAAGERHTSYHTTLDSARLIDTATLQQQGEQMLKLTRHFGGIALEGLESDPAVYFDVAGVGLVSYGSTAAGIWTGVVLLCFAGVVAVAVRRRKARTAQLAKAALAMLATCALVAGACQVLWLVLRLVHPGYRLMLHGSPYNSGWYLAAFVVFSALLFSLALKWLHQKQHLRQIELAFGALAVPATLLLVSTLAMPGVSFLFTWPLLPVLAALAATVLMRARLQAEPVRLALLLLATMPGLLMFAPMVHLLYHALTPMMIGATAVVLAMLYCMASPLLLLLGQHVWLHRAAAAATLALLAGGAWTSGFDAEHPQPDHLTYVQAEAAGPGYLLSKDEHLDAWTHEVLGSEPRREALTAIYGPRAEPNWVKPLSAQFDAAPVVEVLADRDDGALRHLDLTIHSPRRAGRIQLFADDVAVQRSRVQGRDYTQAPTERWRLSAHAFSDDPLRLQLTVKRGQPFALRVRDVSYELPSSVPSRPAGFLAQPFDDSDTSQVVHIERFK